MSQPPHPGRPTPGRGRSEGRRRYREEDPPFAYESAADRRPPSHRGSAHASGKRASRVLPVLLVSVGVVLVLLIGGGLAYVLAGKNEAASLVAAGGDQPSAPASALATSGGNGTPSGGPSGNPSSSPSGTPSASAPAAEAVVAVSIIKPKTLNGRPEVTDPQYTGIVDTLQAGMADFPGATDTVGGLYGSPEKQNFVVVVATEVPVDDPDQELAGTFLSAGLGGVKVSGLAAVTPGPLGGAAQCGEAEVSGLTLAICGWADRGSVGYVMWYSKSVSAVQGEFTKIRSLWEKSN